MQQFEDASVEREVDIRRKMVKIFNKREEDFNSFSDPLRAYNDYLEELEVTVFNLVHKVDVENTKRKIEKYQKENQQQIRKNNCKFSQEEALMQALIESEKNEAVNREKEKMMAKQEEARQKNREKESLINDLIYANAPADEVIARHQYVKQQQQEEEKKKKSFFFSEKSNQEKMNMPMVEIPLYEYKPPVVENGGPTAPTEEDLKSKGYLAHIRPASEMDKAAGYTEKLACRRALHEAFDSLFV